MRVGLFAVYLAGLSAVSGCSRDLPSSGSPRLDASLLTTSHDVSITATVGRRGALGDTVTFRIANGGSAVAYMPRCGSLPLLLVQQFKDGVWTGGVQNFMCLAPAAPGPVSLGPGESIDVLRIFESGQYRMTMPVASDVALTNATQAVSNAFDAP